MNPALRNVRSAHRAVPACGFAVGDTLARRWTLEEVLGNGAMGVVFRATHLALGHAVAVKVLHARAVDDDALARFAREARIAARVSELSPHVTRVIDYGVEQSRPFLVMELLRGEDLQERIAHSGRLDLDETFAIVERLGAALHAAHQEGVVHRDVKPANVFLAEHIGASASLDGFRTETAKLMDFGLAQALDEHSLRAGVVVGTPAYMSPEQILGETVDRRSDLWSLAATVYHALVGAPPFGAGLVAHIARRITTTEPERASARVPVLPSSIDAWFARAFQKEPAKRFPDARAMVASFRVAVEGERARRARTASGAVAGYPALAKNGSGVRPISRVARRDRARRLALAVALAVAGTTGLAVAAHAVATSANVTRVLKAAR